MYYGATNGKCCLLDLLQLHIGLHSLRLLKHQYFVTLGCLASCSFFIALIQPLFLKTRFKAYEIILGLFVVLAIYIIFSFENKFSLGIILSLFSHFSLQYFLFGMRSWLKQLFFSYYFTRNAWGTIMLLYLLLSGEFNINSIIPNSYDWFYILVLGVICTALAFL